MFEDDGFSIKSTDGEKYFNFYWNAKKNDIELLYKMKYDINWRRRYFALKYKIFPGERYTRKRRRGGGRGVKFTHSEREDLMKRHALTVDSDVSRRFTFLTILMELPLTGVDRSNRKMFLAHISRFMNFHDTINMILFGMIPFMNFKELVKRLCNFGVVFRCSKEDKYEVVTEDREGQYYCVTISEFCRSEEYIISEISCEFQKYKVDISELPVNRLFVDVGINPLNFLLL